MNNGLILLHYGIINIIFIDCLIYTIYKPNTITKRILIMDAIKCVLYLIIIIYSYKMNWFLGMLVGSICFLLGIITGYKNYLIEENVYTTLVKI